MMKKKIFFYVVMVVVFSTKPKPKRALAGGERFGKSSERPSEAFSKTIFFR
jgi:hypothetical protein